MAKKKEYEKVTSIVTADEYGNTKKIKLTGKTGGYQYNPKTNQSTPAMSAVGNKTQDVRTIKTEQAGTNDIRTQKTEQPKKTTVGTVNSEGYTETSKKYGDYKYQDYANKKDYKIYTKDNKSYYYDEKNKRYVDMDEQSMTTKDADKKEYKNAVKQGYKGSRTYNSKDVQVEPSKVADKVALESSDLTKEEKEKYKKSLIKQEKQKGKETNFVKRSGTGIDALTGAWNNQIVNPEGTLQKQVIQPISNAGRIYESGKMNNELALEWYKKMQGKPNKADELQAKADTFNRFNQDVASGDIGAVGQTIQNLNTQVESLKNQGIAATAGGVVGGAGGALLGLKTGNPLGGAIKGAKLGSKAGYTFGSTPYMYKLEAGNQYKDLREMGVSHKKAKKVAKAVGSINAAIESGENVIDLLSFSGAGKIASNEVKNKALKQMRDEVGEVVEELGEKQAKGYLTKLYGSEITENILKTYGKNVASEAVEEGTQEAVGILGERYAAGSEGIDRGVSLQQDLQRIGQSGLAGGMSALVMGIPTSLGGNAVSYGIGKANNFISNRGEVNGITNNNTNNPVYSDEQVRAINDIVQQKESGQIDTATANQRIADVQNGTYQQNQNTQAVMQEAQRQFDEINQAEQTGQIDNQSAQQGRQAIINTMNDMQQSQTQEETVETKKTPQEPSLKNAKQYYNRNLGKYTPGDAFESAIGEYQLRPDEASTLKDYLVKKYPDYENEINRRYNDLYNVEKSQEIGYNKDTNEVGVKNDFRTIQEESRAKLNDKGWGSSSKTVDEDLRGRIRGALSEEIKRRGYSDSNNDGLLKLESKGNQFNLHKNVDAETFHDIFEIARAHTNYGELVDLHPVKTNEDSIGYEEMTNYLSEDGMQGFSITKDGDVVSVFNADPSKKGFLRSIENEINSKGKTLDCFQSSEQRLDEIYSKIFGWKTTSIMDHNMEYDHDDIAKNHKNPPVSFMVNPNQLKSDVTDADLNKQFGKDQYDEAVEYRNALMKGGEGNKSDFVFDENGRFVEKRTSDSSFNIDKEKQEIVKSNGKVVTAPIDTKGKNKLANININVNNDGGNNNNIGNNALAKQGDSNNGKEAQILENYKDRKAYKKEPFKERAAEFMHNAVRGLFDSAEEIVRIGKYHNDKQLNPLYDLTLTANSTADFNIGGMKDSYQSNLSGEKIGESLENCWKPVEDAGLVRQMNAYLYEQHNIDRWNQFNDDGSRKYVFGPEHSDLVSKRNIAEMLKVHPELEKLSKPILNYQNNLLKVLVESGQVSQSHADYLNEIYKNYVPTWRDKDVQNNKTLKNSKGKIDINNPLKEATGSTEDLLPLKEVQAQMTKNVFKTSRTNLFGQQLYKDIGDLSKLKDIGMNELNKQYVQNGKKDVVDENAFLKAGEQYLDEYLRDFAPNNVPVDIVKGQKTMNVYFNGVKVAMPIDSGIETALKPLKPQNDAAKILSKINNFKRGVITQYNPGFSISNALKDAPDAMLNSKYGKEFPVEYAKTMKEMLERGISKGDQELFNQYCALGGLSNRTFDGFEGFKQDSKAKKALTFVPNAISDVNDIIEQIPRFTEFKLSLKHGATLSEAMYNAADLTTNFKRGGTLTKALDAYGTTFLSASTGGFYKQVRNITQQPNGKAFLMFAAKGMALGLTPAIINSLLYASPFGDDDDKEEAKEAYEKLKQYEKDDYLLWYRGDGKFIKIPKGRAVSIPAIIYNAVKETAKGNKVNAKDVFTSVLNQIGPNNPLSDNAILSFSQIELLNKKSQGKSWSGSPIESSYMQSLEPRLRYDSKTDEFSKWLGDKLNVSPKKINYVIQQNTGILGDLLLPAITPKTTGPNVLSRTTNFLTKRFTTDTVSSNTTTEKFYDKQTELTELQNNPKKASDKNEIKKMYLNSKGGEIAEKRKEIEEINSNKTMSKDDKYKEIRKKQKEINKIAEDALKESEKVQKEGKYAALIGDNVYVKAKNDKWYKENESNKEKREELGLNVKDYYHYKKDEAFIKPDGKSTSLVDGEKAKEKIALVDAFGFDPSDYLEYEYTINNIKEGKNTKRKVFEYINSLDISQEQKIILMKKKYKTYRSYDRQIFNTINNTDLTLEEKESLANFLKIK